MAFPEFEVITSWLSQFFLLGAPNKSTLEISTRGLRIASEGGEREREGEEEEEEAERQEVRPYTRQVIVDATMLLTLLTLPDMNAASLKAGFGLAT